MEGRNRGFGIVSQACKAGALPAELHARLPTHQIEQYTSCSLILTTSALLSLWTFGTIRPMAQPCRFTLGYAVRQDVLQFRLIIKTVLSSIRYSWAVCRRRSSRFRAYSSKALHISFAERRKFSFMTFSSCRRSSLSLPS
jgi:hypothetical protein